MRRANCLSVFALLKMRMQIVIFMKRYFDNLHYEKFADGRVKCIEDEIPFDLPDGWAWSRIKNISLIGTGATPLKSNSTYYKDGTIPWITSAATSKASITLPTDYITNLALAETNCTIYPVGTLIIAMYGEGKTRGQISELDIEACTNQACAALRVLGESKPLRQYVKLYFQYSYGSLRQKAKGGQQPNLNQTIIADTLIPIPPYKEIDRVIMFASDCFDLVDTIEEDKAAVLDGIGCIKKCILDLAIRGQLVPQDPADEPASVLLERIRAEKEELIKQGKIKRDKKESVIFRGEDNSYYLRTGALVESLEDWDFEELPDGWSVCCLGELCDYGNCTNIDTADIANSAWILDLEDIEKDSGVVLQKVRQGERNAESTKHRFHKGQVLYSKLRPYLNKVVLADEDGYCTSEILPLEFERNILPQYARYFLMSPIFLRYANKCSYGVKMPRLGTTDGKKAIVSVPPIEEQKRIVMAIELAFAQLASITENLT